MARKHSKRRNSGLIYEFLTRMVSTCLVEGNSEGSSKALKILKRYFKPGSQLYNEFRVANALYNTRVTSEAVAASIITEAKIAVRNHDALSLDREKSHLLANVNRLSDPTFFERHVEGYRTRAMIQTLFNEWRSPMPNISTLATYEDELVRWLTRSIDEQVVTSLDGSSPGESGLLMRIMMSKLNERYSETLTETQRTIVRDHVWSTSNDDPARIVKKLDGVRSSLTEAIGRHEGEGEHVAKQLDEVKLKLINEDLSKIDDAMIVRFLQYVKLNDELRNKP